MTDSLDDNYLVAEDTLEQTIIESPGVNCAETPASALQDEIVQVTGQSAQEASHEYDDDFHIHHEADKDLAPQDYDHQLKQDTELSQKYSDSSDLQNPNDQQANGDHQASGAPDEFPLPPPEFLSLFPDILTKSGPAPYPLKDPYPHRHYVTLYPVCNKLLALKWDARQKGRLKNKIDTMRPSRFSYQDSLYLHPHPNMKKRQLEEEKKREIARNNELLVERMRHIVLNHRGVDNVRKDERFIMRKNYQTPWKIQDEKKIKHENEALLFRIEQRKPHLDRIRLLQERLIQVKYLQNISAFPQKYIELRAVLEDALGIHEERSKDYELENRQISPKSAASSKALTASQKLRSKTIIQPQAPIRVNRARIPAPPIAGAPSTHTRSSKKTVIIPPRKSVSAAPLPCIVASENLVRESSPLESAGGISGGLGDADAEVFEQQESGHDASVSVSALANQDQPIEPTAPGSELETHMIAIKAQEHGGDTDETSAFEQFAKHQDAQHSDQVAPSPEILGDQPQSIRIEQVDVDQNLKSASESVMNPTVDVADEATQPDHSESQPETLTETLEEVASPEQALDSVALNAVSQEESRPPQVTSLKSKIAAFEDASDGEHPKLPIKSTENTKSEFAIKPRETAGALTSD